MKNKPVILVFIDWFLPGFKAGGPIRSIANMIELLHENFHFKIVTSDRDLGDSSPYPAIQTDKWIRREKYDIIYLSPEKRISKIKKILHTENFQKIYLNSLFSVYFTILPLVLLKQKKLSEKIILAPRGMLGEGALTIKPVKKKLFLSVANAMGIFKNITWHATTNDEEESILRYFGHKLRIFKVQNLNKNTDKNFIPIIKKPSQLNLVFLSRITHKKNLLYGINILQQIDVKGIKLDIYGSIEDEEYWRKVEKAIQKLKNIVVSYKGELHPDNVIKTLSQYHYLFLPTKHENYGHVIAEALNAGCGLIISDQTPWRNLEQSGVGFDIPLCEESSFIEAIQKAYRQDQKSFNMTREKSINFVNKNESENEKIKSYLQLLSS